MPYLVRLRVDGSVAEQWELTPKPFVVGRGEETQARIADGEASRQHFQIVCKAGKYWIEDKNSRNGTLVNGKRQATVELKFGNHLRAGETQFVFVDEKVTDLTGATIKLPAIVQPDNLNTLVDVHIPKVLKKK